MKFLKNLSLDLTVVFMVCCLALGVYAYRCQNEAEKAKNLSSALENTINNLGQDVVRYQLMLDDTVRVYASEVKTLKVTAGIVEQKYKDLLSATNIKAKNVNQIASISNMTTDTVVVEAKVDSFGGLKTGYTDSFVDISVDIDKERRSKIAYSVRDSLTVMVTQKKHSILFGLFKWKEYEKAVVVNHNPKAVTTHVEVMDIKN